MFSPPPPGFLMLVGTVVNNGILYVDTVNQYRQGMDLHTALIEAGATRLRPILMTTLINVKRHSSSQNMQVSPKLPLLPANFGTPRLVM